MRNAIGVGMILACCTVGECALVYDDGIVHNIDFTVLNTIKVYDDPVGNSTTVNLLPTGRVVGSLDGDENSIINILGGTIDLTLIGGGSTYINYEDGDLMRILLAAENAVVDMYGGTVHMNLSAHDNSTVNLYGGTIEGSFASWHSSTTNVYGGSAKGFNIRGDALVTMYGTGFAFDGNPVPYGVYDRGLDLMFDRQLTGILTNGDSLNTHLEIYDNAQVVLAPVPLPRAVILGIVGIVSAVLVGGKRPRLIA